MNLSKAQLIFVGIVGFVVLLVILIFTGIIPGLKNQAANPANIEANLNFWGVEDDARAYEKIFQAFKTHYPKVEIRYRNFEDARLYKNALLDALAAGTGPDLFMIPNSALPAYVNKISPFPQTHLTLAALTSNFPDVVSKDFVSGDAIFALPLSIDTLALLYNKDILNAAAVVAPPQTWDELLELVPQLRRTDGTGAITRAAVALGGSRKSIANASDIVNLLLLQKGVPMVSDTGKSALFSSEESRNALTFYTQFANPQNSSYTWNDGLGNASDAFAQEKIAMILDYAASLPALKAKNAFLNFAVAPAPQIKDAKPVNYGRYWGIAVSRQSKYKTIAWDFLLSATMNAQNAKTYADATGKPPALRSLIASFANHLTLGPFARQALTAKSWTQIEPLEVSQIFSDMIEAVVSGRRSVRTALEEAQTKVTQILLQ